MSGMRIGGLKRANAGDPIGPCAARKQVRFAPTSQVCIYATQALQAPAFVALASHEVQALVEQAAAQAGEIGMQVPGEACTMGLWRLLKDVTATVLSSAGRRAAPGWSTQVRKTVLVSLASRHGLLAVAADDGDASEFQRQLEGVAADMSDPAAWQMHWQVEVLARAVLAVLDNCLRLHARNFEAAADWAGDVLDSLCEGGGPSEAFGEALDALIEAWRNLDGNLATVDDPRITDVAVVIHGLGQEPRR